MRLFLPLNVKLTGLFFLLADAKQEHQKLVCFPFCVCSRSVSMPPPLSLFLFFSRDSTTNTHQWRSVELNQEVTGVILLPLLGVASFPLTGRSGIPPASPGLLWLGPANRSDFSLLIFLSTILFFDNLFLTIFWSYFLLTILFVFMTFLVFCSSFFRGQFLSPNLELSGYPETQRMFHHRERTQQATLHSSPTRAIILNRRDHHVPFVPPRKWVCRFIFSRISET